MFNETWSENIYRESLCYLIWSSFERTSNYISLVSHSVPYCDMICNVQSNTLLTSSCYPFFLRKFLPDMMGCCNLQNYKSSREKYVLCFCWASVSNFQLLPSFFPHHLITLKASNEPFLCLIFSTCYASFSVL